MHRILFGVCDLKVARRIGKRRRFSADVYEGDFRIFQFGFLVNGIGVFAFGAEQNGGDINGIQNLANPADKRRFAPAHRQKTALCENDQP